MWSLTTERLRLRPWEADDADFVLDTCSREEVQRCIGAVPRLMADRAEALTRIAAWRALADPVLGVRAIADRGGGGGRLLGTVLLQSIPASAPQTPLPPSGDVETGWRLHPDAWGRGVATEAAAAVLRHGFDGGLAEVVAVTNPANTASQAVARRIGMTHRGTTAKYYGTVCTLSTAMRPATS